MTAGSIPVPTVVPLRVPGPGESKFNIDSNTRIELRSVVPASEDVAIYYTINGTRPDPFNKGNHLHRSTYQYLGPFTLPPGKVVLKAVACLPNGKESGVNTKTLHVTYVDPGETIGNLMEDNDKSFRRLTTTKVPDGGDWMSSKNFAVPQRPKTHEVSAASTRTFSPQRSLHREKTDLSFEMTTSRMFPNMSSDIPPKTTQTAMRISRDTDFLRCICCYARRPADPNAKFCNECGYPVSPLTEKQLPPPEPGQMGQCIKCQSTVPLNTDKCVVCDFDLIEQFQPQATLRTAEKKKCLVCHALNPPTVDFCLKCEAHLGMDVVTVKNKVDKPPANRTALLLGEDAMVSCSKCGRVNSADARFCDWCGTKPKHPSPMSFCVKCTASNQPYARFCSTCGAVMEPPERPDPRNTGMLMSGLPVKEAIKTIDSRAAATWLPMSTKIPAKKDMSSAHTQTVGLFYPSTKTLEKYLADDESKKVFKDEKKIPLSGVSPGKGYWRQNVDFIANHLKAHTQNDHDFRKMIGEHKLGKLMSATIHEDGHEFSLVLNFPIRSNREHGSDPFKGKNMMITKNTVVGGYPIKAGRLNLSDESDTDPSDIETGVNTLVTQKDKDIIGYSKQKFKDTKKKIPQKKEPKPDNGHLSTVNRLLFAELGDKGGDVEKLKNLLSEDGADANSLNSAKETLLVVAVKNRREAECVKLLAAHGADVNKKVGPHGNTALHEAVLLGNSALSTVEALLAVGASPQKKNEKGQTPSSLANDKGFDDIVRALTANISLELLEKYSDQKMTDQLDY